MQPATPKDAGFEETRRTHRRHSLETEEAGKLAARSDEAERDDAWSDALRVHTIEAPETPVSGVFVCGRLAPGDIYKDALAHRLLFPHAFLLKA